MAGFFLRRRARSAKARTSTLLPVPPTLRLPTESTGMPACQGRGGWKRRAQAQPSRYRALKTDRKGVQNSPCLRQGSVGLLIPVPQAHAEFPAGAVLLRPFIAPLRRLDLGPEFADFAEALQALVPPEVPIPAHAGDQEELQAQFGGGPGRAGAGAHTKFRRLSGLAVQGRILN